MAGKFEVYQDESGTYRWALKAGNGQVVAVGAEYDTQAAAIKSTRAVQRAAERADVVVSEAVGTGNGPASPRGIVGAFPKKYEYGTLRKSGSRAAAKRSRKKAATGKKQPPQLKTKKSRGSKLIKIEETG